MLTGGCAALLQALERACGKYKRLNAAAMAVTRPGGLLMTCSCSGAVTQGTGLLPILQVRPGPGWTSLQRGERKCCAGGPETFQAW